MKFLRTILIFWLPLVVWLLVVYNFSATPAKDLPQINVPYIDKLFHAVVYFVFGVLLIRAFDKSDFNVSLAKLAVLAIIISICYGISDELHQLFVQGRSCEVFDFLADCAGSFTGIFLYMADTKERRG